MAASGLSKYTENSSIQGSFYVTEKNSHFFHIKLQTKWEIFSFNRTYRKLLSILKLWLSQFVPPKKVSFPEQGLGSFISTYKARFKRDTVTKKEFIRNIWDETGEKIFETGKLLKSLNQPNVLNFKNVCYQLFSIMFKYMYHLPFPLLEQFLKLVDWMGS